MQINSLYPGVTWTFFYLWRTFHN